jgi:hypothetical protein
MELLGIGKGRFPSIQWPLMNGDIRLQTVVNIARGTKDEDIHAHFLGRIAPAL